MDKKTSTNLIKKIEFYLILSFVFLNIPLFDSTAFAVIPTPLNTELNFKDKLNKIEQKALLLSDDENDRFDQEYFDTFAGKVWDKFYSETSFANRINNPRTGGLSLKGMHYSTYSPFLMTSSVKEFTSKSTLESGIKLHVSALPWSATVVTKITLLSLYDVIRLSNIHEISEDFLNTQLKTLPHLSGDPIAGWKIIRSIPSMRDLYNSKNKDDFRHHAPYSVQAGKFITIYPTNSDGRFPPSARRSDGQPFFKEDWRGNQAAYIAQVLDAAFIKAKEIGLLDDTSFLPLVGDAQVGTSGGVWFRFADNAIFRPSIEGPEGYGPDSKPIDITPYEKTFATSLGYIILEDSPTFQKVINSYYGPEDRYYPLNAHGDHFITDVRYQNGIFGLPLIWNDQFFEAGKEGWIKFIESLKDAQQKVRNQR